MKRTKSSYTDEYHNRLTESIAICYVGAAVIGSVAASAISGSMSASAAKSSARTQAKAAGEAADAQLQASREANQLNWNQYQQNLASQSPYILSLIHI